MSQSDHTIDTKVRNIIADHSGIDLKGSQLEDDTDLYEAGMKSLASVQLMFALEAVFEVTFPDDMLRRTTFHSLAAIRSAVRTLQKRADP